MGPSGCGKTTLLKLIAGLDEEFQGEIILNSNNIRNINVKNRSISMVFQEPLLFPNMDVRDNVAFGLKMRKVSKHSRYSKAKQNTGRSGAKRF